MKSRGKYLAILGVVLQVGRLIGITTTVVGMIRAFDVIQASSGGVEPGMLADAIYFALMGSVIGLALTLVGTVLILIALWGTRYRAPWFYTALWVVSIFWLFNIPIGLILGIVVMVYLVRHRGEFAGPRVPTCDTIPVVPESS